MKCSLLNACGLRGCFSQNSTGHTQLHTHAHSSDVQMASDPPAAAPAKAPTAPTAIVSYEALDEWKAATARNAAVLRCDNPKCVHLCEHVFDKNDNVTFKELECSTTVEVVMNGEKRPYYRLQKGDDIYLACHATRTAKSDNKTTNGHVICGACHDDRAHVGTGGCCRACIDELGDAARPSGRASRAASATTPSYSTEADPSGPKLTALMLLNDNFYADVEKLEELDEHAMHAKRGCDVDGGAAQRKAEIARRHAASLALKMEVAEAVNKAHTAKAKLEEDREVFEEATKVLTQFHNNCTLSEEAEEDVNIDTGSEDPAKAAAFFADNDRDVSKLRKKYPKHAERWYGRAPTEAEIEEQQAVVAGAQREVKEQQKQVVAMTKENEEAKAKYAVVVKDVEALEKQMVEDYDDDEDEAAAKAAAASAAGKPKKGGRKAAKKPEEMTVDELAAFQAKKEKDANDRREATKIKKEKVDAYEGLLKDAKKYAKAKNDSITYKSEALRLNNVLETMQDELTKNTEKMEDYKLGLVEWLSRTDGKPDDWNADEQLMSFHKVAAEVRLVNKKKRKAAQAELDANEAGEAGEEEEE